MDQFSSLSKLVIFMSSCIVGVKAFLSYKYQISRLFELSGMNRI